jgi:signal transduction histidine kinase/CHASE1-domain containing sensor protein/CheY-like chemotaxis protein/integral membrane sensor domain MASE1
MRRIAAGYRMPARHPVNGWDCAIMPAPETTPARPAGAPPESGWRPPWRPVVIGGRAVAYPIAILGLALLYFAAARLGLVLATVNQSASPVWPASGLAVAALALGGRRMWPAIALGAFIANSLVGGPLSALPISCGNTLEALIGCWIIARAAAVHVERFPIARTAGFALAAVLASIPSAVIGVVTLNAAGTLAAGQSGAVALTWWTGDALGILLVAAALMAPRDRPEEPAGSRRLHQAEHFAILLLISAPIACLPFLDDSLAAALFLIFPAILLAGHWFGARGSTWLVLYAATVWVAGTALGRGPFIDLTFNDSLLNMQLMLAVLALAGMVFSERIAARSLVPVLVFIAGCTVSAVIFVTVEARQKDADMRHFDNLIKQAGDGIQETMHDYINLLRGGSGFYAAAGTVNRAAWHSYVDHLQLANSYPGLLGMGVALPVTPAEAPQFTTAAQADGMPDFAIHPVPDVAPGEAAYPLHFVVRYSEPPDRNRLAIGLDLASEPTRRNAALTARDSGNPVLSGHIQLVQDRGHSIGFLLFLPFYKQAADGGLGQPTFQGWIYAPFAAREFFLRALSPYFRELRLQIREMNEADEAGDLVFLSPEQLTDGKATQRAFVAERQSQLTVNGAVFSIGWARAPRFVSDGRRIDIFLAAGLLAFSTLLAALVSALLSLRDRAAALAGDMTSALREAEERLRAAIGVMESGFALFDAEDRLVLYNDSFVDSGSRARFGSLIGRTATEIFAAFAEAELTAMQALKDREAWLAWRLDQHRNPPTEPLEVQWTDGRWMRVTERRTADGGYVGLWTDITAVKQAEARLRDAIESINESFVLLDRDLRIVMVNSEAQRMYPVSGPVFKAGTLMEDVLRYGAAHGEYPDIDGPEEVEAFVRQWKETYASSTTFVGEGRLANGGCILISHHATSDGGFVNVYTDITALKRREEDLAGAKAKLEEQAASLARLAAERDRLRRMAEDANAGKSRFLANMSHELRTPLNGILGFAEIIRKGLFGSITPAVYQEYAQFIHDGGTHLLSLINDILDLSKVEAGQRDVHVTEVSTAELIAQSTKLVSAMAVERTVELILPDSSACPVLHADERAVRQILLNLLSNAVKFTPAGGKVTLDIRHAGSAGVEIEVTDTGIGMTPAELEKALQPYGQVMSDWAKNLQGTGLGLPLVKALSELHHGRLSISSARNAGTSVKITLPWSADLPAVPRPGAAAASAALPEDGMAPESAARQEDARPDAESPERNGHAAADASGGAAPAGLRILVADDSNLNQRLTSVLLQRLHHHVECVSDGVAAVERAAAGDLDLILMDGQMPRLGGIEATRQIRALQGAAGKVTIIGITADLDVVDRADFIAAGMDDVLDKPLDATKLAAVVAALMT